MFPGITTPVYIQSNATLPIYPVPHPQIIHISLISLNKKHQNYWSYRGVKHWLELLTHSANSISWALFAYSANSISCRLFALAAPQNNIKSTSRHNSSVNNIFWTINICLKTLNRL